MSDTTFRHRGWMIAIFFRSFFSLMPRLGDFTSLHFLLKSKPAIAKVHFVCLLGCWVVHSQGISIVDMGYLLAIIQRYHLTLSCQPTSGSSAYYRLLSFPITAPSRAPVGIERSCSRKEDTSVHASSQLIPTGLFGNVEIFLDRLFRGEAPILNKLRCPATPTPLSKIHPLRTIRLNMTNPMLSHTKNDNTFQDWSTIVLTCAEVPCSNLKKTSNTLLTRKSNSQDQNQTLAACLAGWLAVWLIG